MRELRQRREKSYGTVNSGLPSFIKLNRAVVYFYDQSPVRDHLLLNEKFEGLGRIRTVKVILAISEC